MPLSKQQYKKYMKKLQQKANKKKNAQARQQKAQQAAAQPKKKKEVSSEYAGTVLLPQTSFELRANSAVRELEIQKFWEEEKTYEQILQVLPEGPRMQGEGGSVELPVKDCYGMLHPMGVGCPHPSLSHCMPMPVPVLVPMPRCVPVPPPTHVPTLFSPPEWYIHVFTLLFMLYAPKAI